MTPSMGPRLDLDHFKQPDADQPASCPPSPVPLEGGLSPKNLVEKMLSTTASPLSCSFFGEKTVYWSEQGLFRRVHSEGDILAFKAKGSLHHHSGITSPSHSGYYEEGDVYQCDPCSSSSYGACFEKTASIEDISPEGIEFFAKPIHPSESIVLREDITHKKIAEEVFSSESISHSEIISLPEGVVYGKPAEGMLVPMPTPPSEFIFPPELHPTEKRVTPKAILALICQLWTGFIIVFSTFLEIRTVTQVEIPMK